MVLDRIEQMHGEEDISYRGLCLREGLSYASLMRWRAAARTGAALVHRPGPKKVAPLDLDSLRQQVGLLRHGKHRTAGTTELYAQHGDAISRRDLTRLVREERDRKKRELNRICNRVTWRVPCLVWAMDDTEYQPDRCYPKAYLHNVQDLGSQFKFRPRVGMSLATGEEVAHHLAMLFEDHGAPLFLKRDNGGNLNHHAVEEIMCEHLVIPVNSPCYYPQYNGGIERAQGEIKHELNRHDVRPSAFLAIQAELDVQALNHKRRPGLGHRTPCNLFTAGHGLARSFTRRKRKEVYDWIHQKMLELIEQEGYDADDAWRHGVETWLLDNRFITVSKKGKV